MKKQKNFKKMLVFVFVMMFLINILPIKTLASSIVRSAYDFTSPWELYATEDSGKANMTYGYNVFAINEDYTWASHSSNYHYAAVHNGNGSFSGPNKPGSELSKIEVTHSGAYVSYYNNY